ncbi:sporulation membrane protein YtrI [Halobacillus salinus]|uniref:Sporulation membrane protein YtrI C-terminal domain-containing protein n=1 Tax=Halobacillus salinus TaxID=192814 RepID=A0A4Z0H290_9BACI|nr:hypothetical protein E4663_03410 [Halobacillus salinus]
MHIPPLYKNKEWRRFLAGIALGAIVGYSFFILIHGQQQETIIQEHIQLSAQLHEAEKKYENLLNNPPEEEDKPLKVRELQVRYTNAKKLEVDLLTQHQLTSLVKELLSSVHGQNLETVADQVDLMISTIESKDYVIDQLTYQLQVKKLIVTEQVSFDLEIKLAP